MTWRPDACQVATFDIGGNPETGRYLATLGHVANLTYSFQCPGGAYQMSCTLQVPASSRDAALTPGRIVRIFRGAAKVWEGKLDEPAPSDTGWSITAHGAGSFGDNFAAVYSKWTANPDDAINQAISRGLQWVNPGLSSPAGLFYGQIADSGSITITDMLNQLTSLGNYLWYVDNRPRGNVITLLPLPDPGDPPDLYLVATDPVARTLGGDYNRIWIKYTKDPDHTKHPAVYGLTSAENTASVAAHGPMEGYMDVSSALGTTGTGASPAQYLTLKQAQNLAQAILNRYQRASFAGPYTVGPGQLLSLGGTPVDLATEQAGRIHQLVLADAGYGGELVSTPITFLAGTYEYNDETLTATITPLQSVRTNFSSLLQAMTSNLQPRHPADPKHKPVRS